jgi:signal transduction histidine kinase
LNILFSNLLRNAFAYTPRGDIVMTIGEGAVAIRDSGVGMDQKMLENVYKPFYRGQSDVRGHGLGLAIVKRFCDRFGWTLQIVSVPDEGTEVTVLFPEARSIDRRRTR